ncbi:MAG: Ig-like domain-containing protein, partial [Chloroflexota bacterium]|nr:Ig-like domain-containing protein [Chloroflexota bacterium]
MSRRFAFTLNCFLLVALVLTSCTGVPLPVFGTPTSVIPTPTSFQQTLPPGLVETDPPVGSVLGHESPITFYFNQPVDKSSAETALMGLPAGSFTWNNDSTLVFAPTQSYPPDTTLEFSIAKSLQSANGFAMAAPTELSFSVADYLRPTHRLPGPDAEDVSVEAAIAVSFNQPVVALGGDPSSQPEAFSIQPPVQGRGEWINTSTYIFYPEPGMSGGVQYTVSLNADLETATGAGLPEDGTEPTTWTFTTSKPRVIQAEPSIMEPLPLDAEIRLTFNQPMNPQSVESEFRFSGTEGMLDGKFSWNEDNTVMTFNPEDLLRRDIGYILNLGATAQSRGGLILGTDYGAVFNTYDNFAVRETKTEFGSTTFLFTSPLANANYDNLVSVFPAVDNLNVEPSEDGLSLVVFGDFLPDTNYTLELSGRIRDRWGQALGDSLPLEIRTPPLPSMLNIPMFAWSVAFVRPDKPVLHANAVNISQTNITLAPLPLQDFFSLHNSFENQQAYVPQNANTYSQTFELPPGGMSDVSLDLIQSNRELLPGLYYVNVSSPQIEANNILFVVSSQVNLTFKLGATEALIWAVDLPSKEPVANAPVAVYDEAGNQIGGGTTD